MFKIGDRVVVVKLINASDYEVGEAGVVVESHHGIVQSWVDVELDQVLEPGGTLRVKSMYPEEIQLEENPPQPTIEAKEFKVGDKVRFKKSSISSGLIDATEEDVFEVSCTEGNTLSLDSFSGIWHVNHFEHLEEEIMEEVAPALKVGDNVRFKNSRLPTNTGLFDRVYSAPFEVASVTGTAVRLKDFGGVWDAENLELVNDEVAEDNLIEWEVGQKVWDVVLGEGIVEDIHNEECEYPIEVDFNGERYRTYTKAGLTVSSDKNRSLYFSEPKITAELYPPKKPFVPTFKPGEKIVWQSKETLYQDIGVVVEELLDSIHLHDDEGEFRLNKHKYTFFKLTEQTL